LVNALSTTAFAEDASFGNSDVVRACLATSKYISGLTAVALSLDRDVALDRFDETEAQFADEVRFFQLVAGPAAQSVLSRPEFALQTFLGAALECTKLSVTKCDPGNIAEQAVFATHALEKACAADFRGEA
jgi:hypothetical protein